MSESSSSSASQEEPVTVNTEHKDPELPPKSEAPAPPNDGNKFKKRKQYLTFLKKLFLPLIGVGLLCGILCGLITGLYQYLATLLTDQNIKIFEKIKKNKKFLPLAFVVNIIIGIGLGYGLKYFSEVRGSGIPYIESVARGNLSLTWYYSLPAMFVISLVGIFTGLSIGSEGPSVYLGGCIGYALGKLIKMNQLHDMLLVAAGSSAGLAVAFDAPLSGLIFALEEVYRKFSTQVIVVSIICVSISQIISHLLFKPRALKIQFLEVEEFNIQTFGVSIFCGITGGVMGAIFNLLIRRARNLYKHAKFLPIQFYVILPEIVDTVLCCFFPDGAYGGGDTLKKVLDNQMKTWEIAVCFFVRFASILFCFGSKISGGIFIPMLSVGGLWGGLIAKLMIKAGYDSTRFSYMAIMTMSSFFTGVVRAPLTAVILPVEFTLQYTGWLGPSTAVAFAYIAVELMRIEPLYEKLMEALVEKRDEDDSINFEEFSFLVTLESMVCGLTVREVILPKGAMITHIIRDKTPLFPTEDTQIIDGDEVYMTCESGQLDEVQNEMSKVF
ncbi:Voltage gated chloride channel family protein [Trichomonas vaginalis G3]|uniref:Voltage gated chloride channel family protein n=1 Tax=Trichomonas vaginalis (strain ATCC PRA-98 / G3) TaxID=412133 RepID=A2EDH3_TRIV3|nr:voltage-gated chloride channel protein [Trichomonas vaginalis G3]EAY09337.1 Voltage gated chloride channel family protein [Trichomonas vaginalis G3]KAI5510807.1 voltage-gated chloride channel protein [Trichomonas vaginalis G3]|eukprot:XP_001321560.1 Voltage gated chloride channel family protein [Trichomonas vaginalis G3]